MALPVKTTADDVRESYLRTKPTGATIAEAKATIRPQTVDARKLNRDELSQHIEAGPTAPLGRRAGTRRISLPKKKSSSPGETE